MIRILSYISWYLSARTAYSLHSPMLYVFCEKVLEDDRWYYAFDDLEDNEPCPSPPTNTIPVSGRQFLFRIAKWWEPQRIYVLGEDIAMQTAYLAAAQRTTPVGTFSSTKHTLEATQQFWKHLDLTHIQTKTLPFSHIMDAIPPPSSQRMLLYIRTCDFTPNQITEILNNLSRHSSRPWVVILDSIRASDELYKAWETWSDGRYGGAWIDLYHTGIWIADNAFIDPVAFSLIHRKYKPFRLGWM